MQASLLGRDKELAGIKRLEEGALLEIKQPEDMKERYPVRSLLRAMPKGLEAYLNAMEAEKFSLQPMDDYGRQLRAAYRVQVSYDAIDSIKWSKALLQGYNQEFLRLQREEPEAGISEKSYNEVKSVLLLGAMMLGGDSNECKKEETSDAAIDAAAADASSSDSAGSSEFQKELACSSADAFEEMKKEMGEMPKVHEDLYLSRTGRVLGIQDRMVMVGKKSPQAFVYVSRVKMHDYGNPKFTLNPGKQETVSLWQLVKEAQKTDEDEAVDAAAAEATEAAAWAAEEATAYAEPAKPVKAKAKKSKAKAKKAKS